MRFPINRFSEFPFYDVYSEADRYWSEQGNHIEGWPLILIDYSLTVYGICEFINALDGIIVFAPKMLQDGGQKLREMESWSVNNATIDEAQRRLNIYVSREGEMVFPLLQLYLMDLC